jgi:hypothetical protein
LHGFEIFSDTKYRIFVPKYLQISDSDSDFDVPLFQVITLLLTHCRGYTAPKKKQAERSGQ